MSGVFNRKNLDIARLFNRKNLAPACLLLAGVAAFIWKMRIAGPIEYVGHADASGYAEMADSILKGRGLEVDYISWYFRKYENIERPEDHWPPFYSFLILPFFLFMGKTAIAAKLPSILISCFAFPLTVYALTMRLARSRAAAFAAGMTILFYTPMFGWSLRCLSDVTFGWLIAAAVLAFLKGEEEPRWHWAAGALLAGAYYAKGSTIALLPAFALYYLLWRLLRKPERKWIPHDRDAAIGMAIFIALLSPWAVRNMVHFGQPLYSTQNHAAGYIGWKAWEDGTYDLYWGEKEPPSVTDKFKDRERLFEKSGEFFQRHFWWVFMNIHKKWGEFDTSDLSTYAVGFPALFGMLFWVLSACLAAARRLRRGKAKGAALDGMAAWTKPFRPLPFVLFFLVSMAHIAFLSICWQPISRLMTPVIALAVAFGYAFLFNVVERAMEPLRHRRRIAAGAALALLTLWGAHEAGDLKRAREKAGYPWRESSRGWMEVGRWIRENAPGSIAMTRNPWELHFYSEEKAVQIPLAPLDRIIEVGKYYGATHLIPEKRRPSLEPWLSGEIPGLTKLTEAHGVELYEIDYEALPETLLEPAESDNMDAP